MEQEKIYTQDEIDSLMKELRLVFPIVRLLREKEVCGRKALDGADKPCMCYEFWKKDKACDNCISLVSLINKNENSKLEYLDNSFYQVISKYVNVEGNNCVIEMIRKMEDDSFFDSLSYEHFMNKYFSYNEKLYKDPLTGAYNRLYFEENKDKIHPSCGVAVMDVDDFKLCNDTYGHKFGDVIIKSVVSTILAEIRNDDIAIRYGGDEIILLIDQISAKVFESKLNKIRVRVNSLSFNEHPEFRTSLSIGAIITDNDSLESAVEQADKFLYTAKKSKNCVVCKWDKESKEIEKFDDKPLILITDDSSMNRMILKGLLEDEYNIIEADGGFKTLSILDEYKDKISLVMLDLVMPDLDGFGVLSVLKGKDYMFNIPIMMISSEDNDKSIMKAYDLGATDYIQRPFVANVVKKRVSNTIKLFLRQRKFEVKVRQQMEERDKVSNMMSVILSYIVGYRNNESGPHVLHVEQITEFLLDELKTISNKYSFSEEDKRNIVGAAGMHDIGKLGVDEKILNKPGKLTKEEFEIMKTHTLIGASMMQNMDLYKDEPFVQYVYKITRWHHERWDGKGYPDGLKGDDIPICAQLVSLADVYDALVSKRVYKEGYTHDIAVEMILNGECGTFNPLLLQCLMNIKERIKTIYAVDQNDPNSFGGGVTLDK